MKWLTIIMILFMAGCSVLGMNKKCTVMPDEVWVQGETAQTGTQHDWESSRVWVGTKWKFQ